MVRLNEEALVESLVGHTITRTRWVDGYMWLWFDDGRVIEFDAAGYDADGVTAEEIRLADVDECAACGQAHHDLRTYRNRGVDVADCPSAPAGHRFAWKSA